MSGGAELPLRRGVEAPRCRGAEAQLLRCRHVEVQRLDRRPSATAPACKAG